MALSGLRLARLWPWIERSAFRRFAFAALVAALASAMHWAIFPITQPRITFIFFIPAIVLTTTLAGRWPGALVAVVGLVNSALMKSGSILIPNSAEQVALISSAVVSVLVIIVGDYYRSLSRRELFDLHELHELSATLASIPTLPAQLELILATYARIHGADKGLISILDPARNVLQTAASVGFDDQAQAAFREIRVGTGAAGQASAEKRRVIIEDASEDPRCAQLRGLVDDQHIRAVHSTPLIARDGHVLGVLTVHLGKRRNPTEREIRIADICARKASVFIERARAEEQVRQRDRRFQSVLEASGVPFLIWSPVRNETGKIVDFRFRYVNTAAAQVMRIDAADYVGKRVLEVMPRAWDESGRLEREEARARTRRKCEGEPFESRSHEESW